jgi:hypothetical protein
MAKVVLFTLIHLMLLLLPIRYMQISIATSVVDPDPKDPQLFDLPDQYL